ncbi:MAG: hypothetical protein C7B43_02565 [Sulfobacillus benefaciens]|uniref:Alpha,alpha-trehalase n=1 Tax=Sulfobacillus benefaciens TaxID=453960 RepID=A0A2T2X9S7_9FIRM|nr:MAG: hypothetical protein C7B43_02565 [Sulfobacillus benefaciens]
MWGWVFGPARTILLKVGIWYGKKAAKAVDSENFSSQVVTNVQSEGVRVMHNFSDEERDMVLQLYERIASWWPQDQKHGNRREDTWISLPRPYITPGGQESAFPELYYWDSYFIVRGLLAQDYITMAKDQIENLLDLVARFGFVPNGNRTFYLTRSQPPLLTAMVKAYYAYTKNRRWLKEAFEWLVTELAYWLQGPHVPRGTLARWFDSGDPGLSGELASEAESGWDFTARFGGDARLWYAVDLNALVYGMMMDLSFFAQELDQSQDVLQYRQQAKVFLDQMNRVLWDHALGQYRDRNFEDHRFSPVSSLASFYPLWTHAATPSQAAMLTAHLGGFERPFGLVATDRVYPSPHPTLAFVQWGDPVVWAPLQLITAEGLKYYGFAAYAQEIAQIYLRLVLRRYRQTGKLYEKYHGDTGTEDVPLERYPNSPFHGWTAGVFAVFAKEMLSVPA